MQTRSKSRTAAAAAAANTTLNAAEQAFPQLPSHCNSVILSHLTWPEIRIFMACNISFAATSAEHLRSIGGSAEWRIFLKTPEELDATLGSFTKSVEVSRIRVLSLSAAKDLTREITDILTSRLMPELKSLKKLGLYGTACIWKTGRLLYALPAPEELETLECKVRTPITGGSFRKLEEALQLLRGLRRLSFTWCSKDDDAIHRCLAPLTTLQDFTIDVNHKEICVVKVPDTLVHLTRLSSFSSVGSTIPHVRAVMGAGVMADLRHMDARPDQVDLANMQHLTALRGVDFGSIVNWSTPPPNLVELQCRLQQQDLRGGAARVIERLAFVDGLEMLDLDMPNGWMDDVYREFLIRTEAGSAFDLLRSVHITSAYRWWWYLRCSEGWIRQ
jgi:hypothetical protein